MTTPNSKPYIQITDINGKPVPGAPMARPRYSAPEKIGDIFGIAVKSIVTIEYRDDGLWYICTPVEPSQNQLYYNCVIMATGDVSKTHLIIHHDEDVMYKVLWGKFSWPTGTRLTGEATTSPEEWKRIRVYIELAMERYVRDSENESDLRQDQTTAPRF